jgi:hypothetical protein
MSQIANFVTDRAGQNSSASGTLPVDGQVAFGNNTELSGVIQFNDGGCVHGIRLAQSGSDIFTCTIYVDAEGPHGAFSGGGHLLFTDATGDAYSLYIYRSKRVTHTVSFNSAKPQIVSILWHN